MSILRFTKLASVVLAAFVLCLVAFTTVAQAQNVMKGATVINEIKHDVSLPLWEMAKLTPLQKHANKEIELKGRPNIKQHPGIDPVVQRQSLPSVSTTNILNFDGQGANGYVPPDTEGAVGATQYVQWVNVVYDVYNKTTGALVLGPIEANSLWSGFGGVCQADNDGDPIVTYDKAAQRWFFAQNVFSTPYTICVAVSTTSDATGTYNRYAFPVSPTTAFPDYPKWGVWPDAYYQSFNVFTDGEVFTGAQVCAADRTNMLAGNAATIQCFNTNNSNYYSLLPSDLDGNTPPPTGSPNYYVALGNDTTNLYTWQFHVDFTTPANSTFTGPVSLTVPNYALICDGGGNRECIPQPKVTTANYVDSLTGRTMYRYSYRNFGTYESLLATQTVAPGAGSTAVAAIRWYEIRTPLTPTLFQAGTIQHPTYSIWTPSIAQDQLGDIAIGLSAASTTVYPSIGYLGRVPTQPPGAMESPAVVVVGGGSQINSYNRWGDYSAMQVDPTDDCTFWYTQEYEKTTGDFNWSTRIVSFKFNSCN